MSFLNRKSRADDNQLDMTSMVDVVFLLLIFFMVTASFSISACLQQPHASNDDPSPKSETVDPDPDAYVEVIVDQRNTYYVTTPDQEETEAPSVQELRSQIRDAKIETGANRLLITAHVDARHRSVVNAWDAGSSIGLERIEMRTTDTDY